jgi:hypothetical protein
MGDLMGTTKGLAGLFEIKRIGSLDKGAVIMPVTGHAPRRVRKQKTAAMYTKDFHRIKVRGFFYYSVFTAFWGIR